MCVCVCAYLFFGDLEGFQVVAYNPEFFFQLNDFAVEMKRAEKEIHHVNIDVYLRIPSVESASEFSDNIQSKRHAG